jgi:hypothetical protein
MDGFSTLGSVAWDRLPSFLEVIEADGLDPKEWNFIDCHREDGGGLSVSVTRQYTQTTKITLRLREGTYKMARVYCMTLVDSTSGGPFKSAYLYEPRECADWEVRASLHYPDGWGLWDLARLFASETLAGLAVCPVCFRHLDGSLEKHLANSGPCATSLKYLNTGDSYDKFKKRFRRVLDRESTPEATVVKTALRQGRVLPPFTGTHTRSFWSSFAAPTQWSGAVAGEVDTAVKLLAFISENPTSALAIDVEILNANFGVTGDDVKRICERFTRIRRTKNWSRRQVL